MIETYLRRYASLLEEVSGFNKQQLAEFDVSPQGVGWNSLDAQITRFQQILKVIEPEATGDATLNDVGCGYGALLDYMTSQGIDLSYRGYDLSDDALTVARSRHADRMPGRVAFGDLSEIAPATYTVASGVFAIRFDHDDARWHEYVVDTLDLFHESATAGFAFNMLTSYSDDEKRKPELYYADPCRYFDLCKRRFSRNVALYHDYSLYDFTIVVRKTAK